jgi:hypothetical protein
MSKQINDRLHILKTVFLILLAVDLIGLVSACIALLPTFSMLADYGQIMIVVTGVISAVTVAVILFEILAKCCLIRSTSPTFSWVSARKSYGTLAKLLLLFNLGAIILGILSAGGEGATPINQVRLYLEMLANAVEVIAVIFYLRTRKEMLQSKKEDTN